MPSDRILRGPPLDEFVNSSVAECVLPRLKSFPRDQVTLVDGETGEKRTIWELYSRSIWLLEGLKRKGLKSNDVVAMLCRNSFEANEIMMASCLGAFTAAGFNGFMKVGEMKHLFGLVKPKFVFCEEEMAENVLSALKLLSLNAIIIVTDKSKNSRDVFLDYKDQLVKVDVESFKPEPVPSPSTQITVILPSSGTSGMPKAIGITHTNAVFHICRTMNSNWSGTVLQLSHFYWMTAYLSFYVGVVNGVERVFLKNVTNRGVFKAIEKFKVHWSFMAPLSALDLVNDPDFEKFDLSSVEYIGVGGSPLTESIKNKVKEKWPKISLRQGYGATETSGFISYNQNSDLSSGTVVSGVSVKIIDLKTGEPLEANKVGEICVNSLGVMKCYVGNEEETKNAIDSDGWYHTGDLGYYDELERLYIVDRIKEMVKVRNMQVAPVEVEDTILAIPGILEAGVVGIPHPEDLFQLVGLVVKEKGSSVSEKDIHDHIEKNLSDYKKLKGGAYFVETLPRTGSGKLQRTLLKALAQELTSK